MLDKVYRALSVVDEARRVVGILTDGDLLATGRLLASSVQRALNRAELLGELQRLQQTGQTVGQVMTAEPVTITSDTTVATAIGLMTDHDIKRLPVVDETGRLVGIVSRIDILRVLSQPPVAEMPRKSPPPGQHVKVGAVTMTNVPAVKAKATLAQVVGLLVSSAQRRVVVVDDGQRVIGIITNGDLIRRATTLERAGIIQSLTRRLPVGRTDNLQLSQRTAAEVMTQPVITVGPETSLSEALRLLLAHRIKRLPVVDAEGRLVGLVGRGGVLQALGQELK